MYKVKQKKTKDGKPFIREKCTCNICRKEIFSSKGNRVESKKEIPGYYFVHSEQHNLDDKSERFKSYDICSFECLLTFMRNQHDRFEADPTQETRLTISFRKTKK